LWHDITEVPRGQNAGKEEGGERRKRKGEVNREKEGEEGEGGGRGSEG
jgi:hypothetical protein